MKSGFTVALFGLRSHLSFMSYPSIWLLDRPLNLILSLSTSDTYTSIVMSQVWLNLCWPYYQLRLSVKSLPSHLMFQLFFIDLCSSSTSISTDKSLLYTLYTPLIRFRSHSCTLPSGIDYELALSQTLDLISSAPSYAMPEQILPVKQTERVASDLNPALDVAPRATSPSGNSVT